MPAKSKKQQRLMGMAYAAKKGELPSSKLSPEIKKIMDSMSKKQIRDFAKTKTSDLPEKTASDKPESSLSKKDSEGLKDKLKIVLEKNGISKIKGGNTRALNLKQYKLDKKAAAPNSQFENNSWLAQTKSRLGNYQIPNSVQPLPTANAFLNYKNYNFVDRNSNMPSKDFNFYQYSGVTPNQKEIQNRMDAEKNKELLRKWGLTGIGGVGGLGLTSLLTENPFLRGLGGIAGAVGGYYLSDPTRMSKLQTFFNDLMTKAKGKLGYKS